jgi:hypothetical protein
LTSQTLTTNKSCFCWKINGIFHRRLLFLWQIFVWPKGASIGPGLKSISGWDIQSQKMEFCVYVVFCSIVLSMHLSRKNSVND